MASLLAIARSASEEAKAFYRRRVWAHAAALGFAVLALSTTAPWNHICSVLALVGELVAWALRRRANTIHAAAETARRSAMLTWAFASDREPIDASDLRATFGKRIHEQAVHFEDPTYYSSELPPGTARLLEMLQESAFWSKHLYKLGGRLFLALVFGLLLITVLIFALLEPVGARGFLVGFARILVPVITFFLAFDLLGQGLDWLEARQVSDRIDRVLERASTATQEEILAWFTDYFAATASAPPIPTFLYRREHDRLDEEWHKRKRRL